MTQIERGEIIYRHRYRGMPVSPDEADAVVAYLNSALYIHDYLRPTPTEELRGASPFMQDGTNLHYFIPRRVQ